MVHEGERIIKMEEGISVTDDYDSGYLMQFQSRESTFDQILEALKDCKISQVALSGMGGSGKTTLAKQVGEKAKLLNIFNLVVFVPVTSTPSFMKIQGEIADQLSLRLGEEAGLAARQRKKSMTSKELVLIILDDVLDRLNLEKIGIFNGCNGLQLRTMGRRMSCKVLMTTSTQEAVYRMGCQPSINLSLLTEGEACDLLRKHADISDGSPESIVEVAKQVAKHCHGLPLASSVIGSTLRGKTVDQWKEVLKTMQMLPVKSLQCEADTSKFIHQIIEVGYHELSTRVTKTIFLICGLFPSGRDHEHEVLIEELSQYAIRLGWRKDEVRAAINDLIESSLLMLSDKSKDHIIMSSLVRDIARKMVYEDIPASKMVNVCDYMFAQYNQEDFQWRVALHRLLHLLYGSANELASSSTTNATFAEEGLEFQDVSSYSYPKVATVPKLSGKMVNFKRLCQVDKSFLPLLKKACENHPQLIHSQKNHSEIVTQSAFDSLGRVLFLLKNVEKRDWVYLEDELRILWKQLNEFKFDLEWLSPYVKEVFSTTKITRIEVLREKEKDLKDEAAKLRALLGAAEDEAAKLRARLGVVEDGASELRERLKVTENKAADVRAEVVRRESEMIESAIAIVME
ncbi:hypothetical protein HN51_049470 [Arachis hypogaea]|uniref:NB-ARC domain-containing protein n=1 Tax=Arachis hypogaea TaxID=3818 RepID=A0A444YEX9_ARAHY|nr:putative disease resistance protein At1g50180 [Arachis ipaensis]XP_016166182.1 putative disease resistance protein At1g50180 [Arachis ipaensis]XP_016166183.1 putative disease resistance protein At1g50180 [Arachis ipaensis]XP_016166184.1 putative disease resistance protein At1g50180 [Arachis ipaensis]XP_025665547.1 putative disease resistance protein At1g50180 [Arachis hypogaea]XP_025665548.1 putative disease resistance protein At1g50180 [Arachis hypogaea]XP_025665549.1 putative disease res